MFSNHFPYTDFHELNADWIIKHFKEFIESFKSIDHWIDEHEKEYEELKKLYDDFLAGRFTPEFLEELHKWVLKNTQSIIGEAIRTVFFEITDDGYFVAIIPDGWDEIIFGTSGLDDFPEGVDFGHLTLTY